MNVTGLQWSKLESFESPHLSRPARFALMRRSTFESEIEWKRRLRRFYRFPTTKKRSYFGPGFFFFSKRNSLFINLPVKKKSTSESDNIFVRVILAKPSIRSGAKQTDRLGPLANSFNGQTRIRLRGYAPQISNLYALSLQCYLLSIYETKIS